MRFLLYSWIPRRLLTRLAGWMASRHWPSVLLSRAIRLYVRIYGIDLSQFEGSPSTFKTFNEFFARPLRPGLRPVSSDDAVVVSPVDGRVSAVGEISAGRLFQAKGRDYSLEELLGADPDWQDYEGGSFVTLYLSPRDYHRFHMPTTGRALRWRHLPGDVHTVSPAGVRHVPHLFSRNERVVVMLESHFGNVAFVAVGAMVVGGIRLVLPGADAPRRNKGRPLDPPPLEKGAELGRFELGSTVILVFRPGEVTLRTLHPEQSLQLGEPIGRIRQWQATAPRPTETE